MSALTMPQWEAMEQLAEELGYQFGELNHGYLHPGEAAPLNHLASWLENHLSGWDETNAASKCDLVGSAAKGFEAYVKEQVR